MIMYTIIIHYGNYPHSYIGSAGYCTTIWESNMVGCEIPELAMALSTWEHHQTIWRIFQQTMSYSRNVPILLNNTPTNISSIILSIISTDILTIMLRITL